MSCSTSHQLGSSAPCKVKSVSIAKMLREPTAGSGKPRRGHGKHCPAAREEPSRDHPQGPRGVLRRGSLHGVARVLQAALRLPAPMGATSCGQHVGLERAHQAELGFEQQNRFRNLRERQRIEKKAVRARADSAQSARQGGTEPGTTRFRDGRRTTGPPAPRRGSGAPAAQPRPRGTDLESAQI